MQVVVHPLQPQGVLEELERLDGIEILTPSDSDGVCSALQNGAPTLVSFRWEERFLQPNLRWIASPSAGFEQFPLEQLQSRDVVLTTGRGVNAIPMAEHTMGLLLACTRRIGQSTRMAANHEWVRYPARLELRGATAVILGLGSIGEEIAILASAFGMRVIGIKRHPDTYRGTVSDVRPSGELLSACEEADVLISVLPGGESTKKMVDAKVLQALGHGFLISVGRGSVIDEEALIAALSERHLRGAGLDVFAVEPLSENSPLWDIPTAVLTPHIGGSGPNYGRRWVKVFRQNLEAFYGREEWKNLASTEKG